MEEICLTKERIDQWAACSDLEAPVALHFKQELKSVDADEHQIVFPPTYADIGYNIDMLADGTKVVTIDSVGSQANRMEPIFKEAAYADLIPRIEIELPTKKKSERGANQPEFKKISLLDLAHRAADATVFACPTLGPEIRKAFFQLNRYGDAGPMCMVAPTSLLFGVWESRGGCGEKRPRIIKAIIRAWDVEVLHASAQFTSIRKMLDDDVWEELKKTAKEKKKELSGVGLDDAPAVFRRLTGNAAREIKEYVNGASNPERRVLGGVLVHGSIERDITVNLVALRKLKGKTEQETNAIVSYLLSTALIAACATTDLYLREGCHLVASEPGQWKAVFRNGDSQSVDIASDNAKTALNACAKSSLEQFRIQFKQTPREDFHADWIDKLQAQPHRFDLEAAKRLIADLKTYEYGGGE
jgi:CRISPR-associated protein Csb1